MVDPREIETGGGDYREVNNSGQYAERDVNVQGDRQDQDINADGNATVNIEKSEQNFYTTSAKSHDRTSGEPPNNLPRGVARDRFFGRDADLAQLHNRLAMSDPVAVTSVQGMGGVGKSELAVQYARQYLAEYRGGVVWLSGDRAALDLLSFARVSFARGALFPEVKLAEKGDEAAQLQFVWDFWPASNVNPPGSVLLMFDDVTDYGEQVAPCLKGMGDRFRVLVTTRQRFSEVEAPDLETVDLDVLKPLAAMRLLVSSLGDDRDRDRGRDRVCREARTARDLLHWLGRLPLAIALVGALLKQEPDLTIAQLFGQLKDERLRHEAIEPIEVAFEVSWRRLSPAAQQLAMGLSVFAEASILWELVEATIARCRVEPQRERKRDRLRRFLTRKPRPQVEQWCVLLDEPSRRRARSGLEKLSLLDRVAEGRYRLHPLVREFFAAKLTPRLEATDWRRSFAIVMVEKAEVPPIVTLEMQAELQNFIPHLEAATAYTDLLSVDNGEWGWAFTGLARYYEAQSLFESAERCWQKRLTVSETRFGAERPETATSLNNLALLYYSQGKYETAEPLCQRALDIRERQLGADHPDTAQSLSNLAWLYRDRGQYAEALPLYQQALAILQNALGEQHPSTQNVMNWIAIVSEKLANLG